MHVNMSHNGTPKYNSIKYTELPFKTIPNNNHVLRYKNETGSMCNRFSTLTLEIRWSLLLSRCSCSIGTNSVYSRAERVFIVQHDFNLNSFSVVREAFSNA
jgi:hypothetical protein